MTVELAQVAELSSRVIAEVEKAIIGKHTELEKIMAAILVSGGHVLLEDYPVQKQKLHLKSIRLLLKIVKELQLFLPVLFGTKTIGQTRT
mgnify:CR=1 FL=1